MLLEQAIIDSMDDLAVGGHTHHPGMHGEDLRFRGLDGKDELTLPLPEGKKAFLNVGSTGQPRLQFCRATPTHAGELGDHWFIV